jgi:HlyD family secretion protein
LLAVVLWPTAVQVDVAAVSTGPLVVTVDEEGVTRVRDRFVVSAPVSGRVLRIELEPGDCVKRGQVVARVRAEAPPLLDARTRTEAEAVVESARAALGRARAEEQRARATLEQARRDLPASGRLSKTASLPNRSSRRTSRMSTSPGKPPMPPSSRFAPPHRSFSAQRRGWRPRGPRRPAAW